MAELNVHQVTFREQWNFRQAVEGLARHGIHSTAVWREKLHEVGVAEGARILRDNGMAVSGLAAGGLVTAAGAEGFQAALDDSRRFFEEAAAIGADHVVFLAGGLVEGSKDLVAARERALEGIGILLPDARVAGVKIGIEPLHPMMCATRSVLATLRQANDWCDRLDADDIVGIVVDTYTVWWDPEVLVQIARAGKRICAFHVNDWLTDTQDIRLDRGMMGDGVIDIAGLRGMVDAAGYSGPNEVEIFSARYWWRRDPDEVIETIKARAAALLAEPAQLKTPPQGAS